MSKDQLFMTLSDIELPSRVVIERSTGITYIKNDFYNKLAYTFWPTGKPCVAVNYWLLTHAHSWTGDSGSTYASILTHFIKHAYITGILFHEMTDFDLSEFKAKLVNEKNPTTGLRARKNNQVRRILRTTLIFLIWYQRTFLSLSSFVLIGIKSTCPQITVTYKKSRFGQRYVHHRSFPPKDSKTRTKKPIPDYAISKVEDTISNIALARGATLAETTSKSPIKTAIGNYLYQRRMFMVWISKKTGLRPSELFNFSLEANANLLITRKLILPTKKTRRKGEFTTREFDLTVSECLRVNRYITARSTFVNICKQRYAGYESTTYLMLTHQGSKLSQNAMARDYKRLVGASGLVNVRGCLSTFRHRFITREVVAYLNEIMASPAKRSMITDFVFQSILKRVSTKTGHLYPDSLWEYIDLACQEIEMFSVAEQSISKMAEIDDFRSEMNEFIHLTKQFRSQLSPEMQGKLDERTKLIRDIPLFYPGRPSTPDNL